jgi:hypothetical protein
MVAGEGEKLRGCHTDAIQIFAFKIIRTIGFSTSASIRPHKKAVKKIEAEGAKEKLLLLKLGSAIRL